MPKKQVRNAFYFFMKEEEPKLRREGRVFPNGMADMVPVCHPRWKALPEKDKERFEKMAKEYKQKMKGKEGDKFRYDNQGNVLAYRTNPLQENEKRRMHERNVMKKNWPGGLELAKEKFYFISFEILCVTEDEHYLPCEIALIEYSIEKGITKHMHRFIEPGKIPTGYRFTCLEHSQDTHQIPIENFELADSNYLGLWNQIENFINPNGEKNEYPPLYCLAAEDNYKMIEYCIEWVHMHACIGMPNRIKHVFEIESLFHELYLHVGKTNVTKSQCIAWLTTSEWDYEPNTNKTNVTKSQCIAWLTMSEWDYEPNTKCKYHEELEVKRCALGSVNRFAYAISDRICGLFEIELTEEHLPMRKNLPAITVLPPASMPVFNNQNYRPPPRMNTSNKPQKKEVLDDEYSDLRKPKEPGQFTSGRSQNSNAWGGSQQENIPAIGRGRGMQYDSDFPAPVGGAINGAVGGPFSNGPSPMPMGRGLSTAFQGMSMNPGPAAPTAPAPTQWRQQPVSVGFQEPMGIGRGMIARDQSNSSMAPPPGFSSAPPGFSSAPPAGYQAQNSPRASDLEDDYAPLRLPGQKQEAPSQPSPVESAPKIQIGRGTGRGYGGILENLMREGKTSNTPIGRGIAPPSWVNDGSLGPRRK